MSNIKDYNKFVGAEGEILATKYLKSKKYKILGAGYSGPYGEIDIIAQKGDIVAFVEVKTRNENSIAAPREAVTFLKQDKIKKTAARYLLGVKLQPRFDIIEVILDENKKLVNIEHIENAFE